MSFVNQKVGVLNSGVQPLVENVLYEVLASSIFKRKLRSAISLQVRKYWPGSDLSLKLKLVFWHLITVHWVVR